MKWGNQESIRPVTRGALNANASARVNDLSTPKKDFLNDHPLNRNRFGLCRNISLSIFSCSKLSGVVRQLNDSFDGLMTEHEKSFCFDNYLRKSTQNSGTRQRKG